VIPMADNTDPATTQETQEAPETVEGQEETPQPPEEPQVEIPTPPLFGRYDVSEVAVEDPGLARYINLRAIGIPHQGGKYANRQFGKAKTSVVERLINGMMRSEMYTGKKLSAYKVVEEAFEIIASKTKANPIQVLVEAIQNSAPKEEVTRLRFGGIRVPKAVDTAPQRRLDIAIRNITRGARDSTYKSRKSAAECLADELMRAAKGDMQSFAVAKKEDTERVARSAR
jgi:small subunit ribosomal protein S7